MSDEPTFTTDTTTKRARSVWITDNEITTDQWMDTDTIAREYEQFFNNAKAKYVAVARDIAPTTEKRHLHVFATFPNAKAFTAIKGIIPRGQRVHFCPTQTETHRQNAIAYIKSKDWFREWGTPPQTAEDGGRRGGDIERERWATAYEHAKRGRFDDISPEIAIAHWGNLIKIRDASLSFADFDGDVDIRRRFFWLVSAPGTGKSALARELVTDISGPGSRHYDKMGNNKWWDGYLGEDVSIIDDFAPGFPTEIKQAMKIWTDRYAFRAESKGSSARIRPPYIFVTSNYSILQCFGKLGKDDMYHESPDSQAMERRFSVIDMDGCTYQGPLYRQKKEEVLSLLNLPRTVAEPEPTLSGEETQPLGHIPTPEVIDITEDYNEAYKNPFPFQIYD